MSETEADDLESGEVYVTKVKDISDDGDIIS